MVLKYTLSLAVLFFISQLSASEGSCLGLFSPEKSSLAIEQALDDNETFGGTFRILEYKNINKVKNKDIKLYVSQMRNYIEANINLEIDSSVVSTVGKMEISVKLVLDQNGEIVGGSIQYFQEGAQHPEQKGRYVSRHFSNRAKADQAGYTIKTGWSFDGKFDDKLNKIGWWDPENAISFIGY